MMFLLLEESLLDYSIEGERLRENRNVSHQADFENNVHYNALFSRNDEGG